MVFQIIEMVAADSEDKGMFEDSVKLYDLAGNHEKTVELLCKLLAQVCLVFSRHRHLALNIDARMFEPRDLVCLCCDYVTIRSFFS